MTEDNNDKEGAIHRLRNLVEKQLGYGFNTPADFKHAAAVVAAKTGRPISATTLMRIWGYVQDGGADYRPTYYSLSTLAIYLGYMDYKRFAMPNEGQTETQSAGYTGRSADTMDIPVGSSVCIKWEPDRHCVLRRLEGQCFEVTEAINCKILVGDIVECSSFTQDAPLYCSKVWRNGQELMTYVAGSKTGIRYRMV